MKILTVDVIRHISLGKGKVSFGNRVCFERFIFRRKVCDLFSRPETEEKFELQCLVHISILDFANLDTPEFKGTNPYLLTQVIFQKLQISLKLFAAVKKAAKNRP